MTKFEMNKVLDFVLSSDAEMNKLGVIMFEEKNNGRNDYRLLKEVGRERGVHPYNNVARNRESSKFFHFMDKMSRYKHKVK